MDSSQKPPPQLEILTGTWSDLQPHAERAALFIVQGDLDLTEVAHKIIGDDVTAVGAWISTGAIQRPNPTQIKTWDESPGRTFRFAIVQPYVLIQEQGH